MITKERLEELIKAEETIYTRDSDVHLLSRWHFVIDGKLYENHRDESEYLYDLEELFESEEDAEFALKYQNITRTETLSLPTWEEFEKNPFFAFISKSGKNVVIEHTFVVSLSEQKILKKDETSKTVLGVYYVDYFVDRWENLIQLELTKENYLKACEMCKKLFLGEEEE